MIDGGRVLGINFWLGESASDELITLQWGSPAEEDAVEYQIERSTNGGKTFTPVRTIRKGVNKQFYELNDTREETAIHYRVVMTSKDGAKTISEVLKVDGVIKISAYPNPVRDQLLVKHPQAEAGAAVQVVGMDGRRLVSQNVTPGAVQTTVNVRQLLPGNYFVVYSVNGKRQSKSFVKQ
ncbi:T9SS type A sorting domain-containing protein [Paraflavitalea speifideaquila]|uniref:T9SS type A sorting domain-containing protein n=1 Tax=Paraflavitalea speifideaquila TaxID=3076558 RepID=UPI0028E437CD|nr:T9SS type A sorting domain-containing protein [Paraflavitalea speifideiaquila]